MVTSQTKSWQLKSYAYPGRDSTVLSRSLECYSGYFQNPWYCVLRSKAVYKTLQRIFWSESCNQKYFSPRPSLSRSLTVFLWLPGRQLAHTAQLWVSLLRYLFTGLEHLMWGQTAVMITDFCSSPLQMGPDAKLLTGQRRCHLSCSRWQTLISDGLASL